MASLPVIKPLDGADGYLRWKETLLLHLNTAGVAHVLSEDPPSGGNASSPAAARKWAREDAVCRGHILAALSDRLLPDYVRYTTGRAVWEAVARTYQLDEDSLFYHRFLSFKFDDGAPLLEQLAHLHALAVHAEALHAVGTANMVRHRLPPDAQVPDSAVPKGGNVSMDMIWSYARIREEIRIVTAENDLREEKAMAENPEGHLCRRCYNPGHLGKNCKRYPRRS